MNLTILGNCATQTLEHETTSFLLDTGEKKILIDCGPSTVRQLQKAGVSPLDISAIIITHCHADHTAGYPYLLFLYRPQISFPLSFHKIPKLSQTLILCGL